MTREDIQTIMNEWHKQQDRQQKIEGIVCGTLCTILGIFAAIPFIKWMMI